MEVTIFTPTYNRAYTLSRLYQSLLKQDCSYFQWLIVDDGSTDKTKELVETFISEGKIKIDYYYQENQGKHIAINTGVEYAKGEYFIVIDSDDYFVDNAMEIIKTYIQRLKKDERYIGFTGIHFAEDKQDKIDFSLYGQKEAESDEIYRWQEVFGELMFCYSTAILRKYPFPCFQGEKFCPEFVVHSQIAREKGKILYTDHILVRGNYMEDGLSNGFYRRLLENPQGAMLFYRERLLKAKDKKQKLELTKRYWNVALRASQVSAKEKLKIIPVPIYYTIRAFFSKEIFKLFIKTNFPYFFKR